MDMIIVFTHNTNKEEQEKEACKDKQGNQKKNTKWQLHHNYSHILSYYIKQTNPITTYIEIRETCLSLK